MTTLVYVSNADSGDISVLRMDAGSGELTPLRSATIGGAAGPLAVSPDRRFLYAARRSEPTAVLGFAINPQSGELSPVGEAALPASMAYLSTDRSGRHLLSASYAGHLITVGPIAADGRPQAVQQVLPTEPHAHAVLVDPSKRSCITMPPPRLVASTKRFDGSTNTACACGSVGNTCCTACGRPSAADRKSVV